MAAVMNDLTIRRLSGSLGAEVRGISLSGVTESEVDQIRLLLLEHLVLFFPDQHLDVDAHVAFGAHFGELEAHPNLNNPFTQHPQIFELAASHGGLADEWHSDITFEEHPSIMSILNMVQSPAAGGDTMWANAYAAYEALSPPLQALCDGLSALHDAAPHGRPEQTWIHPVVRKHPETGRKSLFVNEHFTRRIVELSHAESELLLGYLVRWISSPPFTVRYQWSNGTIAMWDNRCTQHYVISDFSEQRIIHRVTVMGDTPEAAVEPRWEPYTRGQLVGATSRFDKQLNRHLGRKISFLDDNAK